jgi:hypothetical protein
MSAKLFRKSPFWTDSLTELTGYHLNLIRPVTSHFLNLFRNVIPNLGTNSI